MLCSPAGAIVPKTFWPHNLAVFYPYLSPKLTTLIWMAGGLLILLSALLLWLRRFPYLAVGWLWYIGTLVPVIGLVQVGSQAMADRYTYVPSIGLFILIVFGAADLAARFQIGKTWLAIAVGLALAGCLVVTRQQVGYWRSSETLFRHAIAVTQRQLRCLQQQRSGSGGTWQQGRSRPLVPGSNTLEAGLRGRTLQSGRHIRRIETSARSHSGRRHRVAPEPRSGARALSLLASQLLAEGDAAGAEAHYQSALAISPDYAEAHYPDGGGVAGARPGGKRPASIIARRSRSSLAGSRCSAISRGCWPPTPTPDSGTASRPSSWRRRE